MKLTHIIAGNTPERVMQVPFAPQSSALLEMNMNNPNQWQTLVQTFFSPEHCNCKQLTTLQFKQVFFNANDNIFFQTAELRMGPTLCKHYAAWCSKSCEGHYQVI